MKTLGRLRLSLIVISLQIPIDREVTIGGRTFQAGTVVNTGLDVPAESLIP